MSSITKGFALEKVENTKNNLKEAPVKLHIVINWHRFSTIFRFLSLMWEKEIEEENELATWDKIIPTESIYRWHKKAVDNITKGVVYFQMV